MARTRPYVAIGVVAALALVAAGCGGGDDNGGGGGGGGGSSSKPQKQASSGGGGGAGTLSESMTDFKFSNTAPTVKAKNGSITVSLSNDGGTTHAMEIESSSGEFKSKQISPGQKTTLTAKLKPGNYEFYCPVDGHKQLGMKGKITVQ
jgi:plastocyanin